MQTRHHRDHHRSAQKHLPNRAFTPSQSHQLPGQSDRRPHCLLPSAEKAYAWAATACSSAGVAYPEITLRLAKREVLLTFSFVRCLAKNLPRWFIQLAGVMGHGSLLLATASHTTAFEYGGDSRHGMCIQIPLLSTISAESFFHIEKNQRRQNW